jgi:regulatory protein
VGRELSSEDVGEFQESAGKAKVYALALRYLSVRLRSVREMRDYLGRKGIEAADMDDAIDRLTLAGLLNDRQFAASWIANRQTLRPRSQRMLMQELMKKGLARDDIVEALADIEPEGELVALEELIEKKRRLPQYRESEKLMGYLARQGYGYDLIKRAIERLNGKEHG